MIDINVIASGSKGNCYYIDDGVSPILIDPGIRYKEIQAALDYQVSGLAGCLVSHEHKDHCKAVKDIIKAGVDCYMAPGTAEMIGIKHHRIKKISALNQFSLGTWTVLSFPTQHDAKEPLGFLLRDQAGDKLLYVTDTYYLRYRFKGLTHIMIECNYAMDILLGNNLPTPHKKRVMRSHFSLDNVKEFLKANDLSRTCEIHLLHLSDGNSDAARFKREIERLTGKPTHIA